VKKILFAMLMLIVPAAGVAAVHEEIPEFEVFGGYSLLKLGASDVDTGVFQNGLYAGDVIWKNSSTSFFLKRGAAGSIAFNLNEYFSVVADARYNRGDLIKGSFEFELPVSGIFVPIQTPFVIGVKNVSGLVGPRVSLRKERSTAFFHALAGLDYWRLNIDYTIAGEKWSDKAHKFGPGIAIGGGYDINVNKKIAVRVIQADYYMTRQMEQLMNNVNLSFGIVFRVGEKVLR
jgi:opacity protein-like surface antigen